MYEARPDSKNTERERKGHHQYINTYIEQEDKLSPTQLTTWLPLTKNKNDMHSREVDKLETVDLINTEVGDE